MTIVQENNPPGNKTERRGKGESQGMPKDAGGFENIYSESKIAYVETKDVKKIIEDIILEIVLDVPFRSRKEYVYEALENVNLTLPDDLKNVNHETYRCPETVIYFVGGPEAEKVETEKEYAIESLQEDNVFEEEIITTVDIMSQIPDVIDVSSGKKPWYTDQAECFTEFLLCFQLE